MEDDRHEWGWKTCLECRAAGMTHASRAEIEADPIGTWRRLWRGDMIAVRWYDHPCDAIHSPASPDERYWPKAWAVFSEWGVDEVGHVDVQESHRIPTAEAISFLLKRREATS